MTSITRCAALPTLTVIACSLASSRVTDAQLVSARPASVALTVVVPPRPSANLAASANGSVSFISATPTTIDLEAMVHGLDPSASRLEVRLGGEWSADSAGVLVRNARGEFERLSRGTGVVAIDALPIMVGSTNTIRFRVASAQPRRSPFPAIPLEYRLTVGRGEEFQVWSFTSLLQVDAER